MKNRSQLRESLQYLEYVSEVIGTLKGVDLTEAQRSLGTAISFVQKAYRDADKEHNEEFKHRREMSETSANLEQKYRSQKRMTYKAKVAVAVARENLTAALKTGNEKAIEEARKNYTATVKRRITAEQHESAAKREAEEGAF
jgi:hypothetical protein